jgi:hypothetical protein
MMYKALKTTTEWRRGDLLVMSESLVRTKELLRTGFIAPHNPVNETKIIAPHEAKGIYERSDKRPNRKPRKRR